MRAGYAVALLAIGGLSMLGSLLVSRLVAAQAAAGEVINVAGRQRMLSQRVGLLLGQPDAGPELDEAVSRFATAHRWLQRAPAGASPEALAPVLDGPDGLDARVTRFLADVQAGRAGDEAARGRAIAAARGPLLALLERQVAAHTAAAREGIEGAVAAEQVLRALVLLLLVLEAALIFRPLLRQLGAALRRAEAALGETAERERHLREVLDSSGEGFAVLTGSGALAGEASTRLAHWFEGFAAEPLTALWPDATERARVRTALAALGTHPLAEREALFAGLPRRLTRGAQVFALEYRLHAQHPPTVLLVVRDVSAEVALEQAERRAQQITTERLAALARLAAGVAHEISTPAAYIQSNVEFALEELGTEGERPNQEVLAALHDTEEGLTRIRDVLAAMRDLSLEQAGAEGPIDPVATLAVFLKGHDDVLAELSPAPRVGLPAPVLTRVLRELLANATRAARQAKASGAVLVRTGTDARGWAVLEVEDEGVGMSPDVAARAFDPFFTTQQVGQGTGLGLFRCHALVGAAGGELTCESREGHGTRVRVALPPAALAH